MSVPELLARIDRVTLDDTQALAAHLLGHPGSLAVIGPYEDGQDFAA